MSFKAGSRDRMYSIKFRKCIRWVLETCSFRKLHCTGKTANLLQAQTIPGVLCSLSEGANPEEYSVPVGSLGESLQCLRSPSESSSLGLSTQAALGLETGTRAPPQQMKRHRVAAAGFGWFRTGVSLPPQPPFKLWWVPGMFCPCSEGLWFPVSLAAAGIPRQGCVWLLLAVWHEKPIYSAISWLASISSFRWRRSILSDPICNLPWTEAIPWSQDVLFV